MPYITEFSAVTYPDESGRPCALMFRIAIIASSERLAVVHLRHVNPAFQSPLCSYVVRDQILNRILDSQLRGVPLKAVRLVVEDADESALFPIEIDLQDSPGTAWGVSGPISMPDDHDLESGSDFSQCRAHACVEGAIFAISRAGSAS